MGIGAGVGAPAVADDLFRSEPPALLAGRCERCGWTHFPRQAVCPNCRSSAVAEIGLAGDGVVYSYTVIHAAPPNFPGPVPYALGVVELPEDEIRVEAILLADDLDAGIAIGDPVEFRVVTWGEGDEARQTYAYEVKR
jgi:uncharacterized protein